MIWIFLLQVIEYEHRGGMHSIPFMYCDSDGEEKIFICGLEWILPSFWQD